jgi:hypothetical protein
MCEWCPQQFFCAWEDYKTHVKQMHAWCELCDNYAESAALLDTHKRWAYIYCDECQPWEKDSYSEHFSARHGQCRLCNAAYSSPLLLKQHIDTHPKFSWCPDSEPFVYQVMLNRHMQEKHPACMWCNAGNFALTGELDRHMKKKHTRL